jgi:hypothetical protein
MVSMLVRSVCALVRLIALTAPLTAALHTLLFLASRSLRILHLSWLRDQLH